MSSTAAKNGTRATSRIDIGFTLEVSGLADVKIRRRGRSETGSKVDRDVHPPARAATPQEAKKFIERYLDLFRFPIEVEDKGVNYGFIPRVGLSEGKDAVKLTVTVLVPPAGGGATLMSGGSKSVEVPLDEIYVRDEELNRKTKEGILALVKGLCITLGRERGLASEIDITRPGHRLSRPAATPTSTSSATTISPPGSATWRI